MVSLSDDVLEARYRRELFNLAVFGAASLEPNALSIDLGFDHHATRSDLAVE